MLSPPHTHTHFFPTWLGFERGRLRTQVAASQGHRAAHLPKHLGARAVKPPRTRRPLALHFPPRTPSVGEDCSCPSNCLSPPFPP